MPGFYKNLKWDSELFGYKVACIKNHEINDQDYNKKIKLLKKKKYKLIYWFVDPNDSISNKTALSNGLILIDEKVTFHKKLVPINIIEKDITEYCKKNPTSSLINLSFQSGIFSRFNIDNNFKNNEFEKLYTVWIEKSVKKEKAKKVFVHYKNGIVDGLITVFIKNGIGEIGLLAVDSNSRGKAIGTKLLDKANYYFFKYNCKDVLVVTQLRNKQACNFYLKNGFSVKEIINIYHIWI